MEGTAMPKNSISGPILSALAALTLPAASLALAQTGAPPPDDLVDRFSKGRAVIAKAVQAAGGAQALRGLNAVSYTLEGDIFNDIQGHSPLRIGNPERDSRQRIVNRIDWAGSRFSQTVTQTAESGFNSRFATIWREGTSWSPRWIPRDYVQTGNSPSPFQAAGAVMVSSRWLPPVILKRALQNQRSVNWIASGLIGAEATDIVDFSFDEATRFRLHVIQASGRIARVETLAPDPVSADDASIADFEGDQVVAGLHFPTRIRASRRGFVNQDFAMSAVTVNPVFAPADFAVPDGFTRLPDSPAQLKTTQVSGRVYEISGLAGGNYQVPFVVMDDFVVAYDAPLGIPQTRQVIAEIRKVAGSKPIRYVVVSHFHADHAGGVGAYAEEGTKILSSANSRAVLEAYARNNRSRLQGQEGPKSDLAISFEAIPPGGKTLLDAKGSKLEIVDLAGERHVDHMFALFDPQSRVLMTADHYIEAVSWNPTFARTANWVKNERRVDTLLGVHIRPLSRAELLARAKGPHRVLD
jgi:glyoxylase-like metal-dependent hydrolase (beta-lactamase superfamily II)